MGRAGIYNSVQTELLAVFYGLRLAWDKGIRRLIVELDSKTMIILIYKESEERYMRFWNLFSQLLV